MSQNSPRQLRRNAARAAFALAVIASPAAFSAAAGAGVTNFSLSPASGPPGTVISVSGTGCSPGLVVSSPLDYVQIAVTTIPSISARLPVAADGSWTGTLTIPAGAAAAPAAVTAICVSDGLQSLFTVYVPRTFTVKAQTSTSTPTTPSTPPTTPRTTTTIGHRPTTSPSPTDGTTTTTRSPTGAGRKPPPIGGHEGGGNPSAGNPGAGNGPAAHAKAGSGAGHASTKSAADLSVTPLAAADGQGGAISLGWIPWLLLVLLLAGVALAGWYRTRRDPSELTDDADVQPELSPSGRDGAQERGAFMQVFGEISGVDPVAGD